MSRKLTVVGLNAANAIARAQTAAAGAETDAAAAAASAATAATKATEAEAAKTGAEAARDQARDISNIDTTDDAVDAALNLPGSKSAATLSASIATEVAPLQAEVDAAPSLYAPGSVPADITGTHVGGYDRRLSIYNLKPSHFRKIRAALGAARAGTGLARIVCAGDSITVGEGATPYSTNAWPNRLRDLLVASGVPSAGSGLVLALNGASTRDARWTGASGNFDGGNNVGTLVGVSDGTPATFTSTQAGTVVEVLRHNDFGLKVTIDGGTPTTLADNNLNALILDTITGLADTTHTVVLGGTSTGYVAAAGVRKTTGVHISALAWGGRTSTDFRKTPGTYQPAAAIAQVPADLVLIKLGTNDVLQSVSAATFKTNMLALIDQFRAGSGTPDVALIAPIPGGSVAQSAHRIALYEVADEKDVPLLDLHDRWGAWPTPSTNGQMTDNWHPNAKGYGDIAAAVAAYIANV